MGGARTHMLETTAPTHHCKNNLPHPKNTHLQTMQTEPNLLAALQYETPPPPSPDNAMVHSNLVTMLASENGAMTVAMTPLPLQYDIAAADLTLPSAELSVSDAGTVMPLALPCSFIRQTVSLLTFVYAPGMAATGIHSEIILAFQDMQERRDTLARELKKDEDEKIK